MKISWQDKVKICELADELNIGTDSMVFDDGPWAERQIAMPEVIVDVPPIRAGMRH